MVSFQASAFESPILCDSENARNKVDKTNFKNDLKRKKKIIHALSWRLQCGKSLCNSQPLQKEEIYLLPSIDSGLQSVGLAVGVLSGLIGETIVYLMIFLLNIVLAALKVCNGLDDDIYDVHSK